MTFGNFFQVVEDTFEQGDSEEIRLFVGIARRLWLRRNDVVYGGSLLHPSLLVQRAIVAREEYTQANEAGVGVSMQMVSKGPMMWKAPSMGWKKMNWDASIAKDKNWMGFGMVLRDEQGAVLAAFSKTVTGRFDVLKAEAKACLTAIQFCQGLGILHIHLEGDAQGVISAINSEHSDWSSMGVLVEDIKHELQSLQQWQLSFVRREGNQAAHTLANLASRCFMNNVWLHSPPDCIAGIVQREYVTSNAMILNQ